MYIYDYTNLVHMPTFDQLDSISASLPFRSRILSAIGERMQQ